MTKPVLRTSSVKQRWAELGLYCTSSPTIRGISMETKEKYVIGWNRWLTQYLSAKGCQGEISRCQAWSIFSWSEGRQWQADRSSPVFSPNAPGGPSGPYSNRHKDGLSVGCCGNVSDIYLKLSSSGLQGFQEEGRVSPSQVGENWKP